jgi:hypothetical protein
MKKLKDFLFNNVLKQRHISNNMYEYNVQLYEI